MPSLPNTISETHKRYLKRAFILAILVRILLWFLGYLVLRGLLNDKLPLWDTGFTQIMVHWDANHYLSLAEYGYGVSSDDNFLFAFFPLYPFLITGLSYLIPNYILAALGVSFVASVAVGFLLQDLMRLEDYDEDTIYKACLLCFFFPTAIHAALPFSEALFLACVLGAFWAARQKLWHWASLAGILACATRINGLILLPALAFEAFSLEKKAAIKRAFWLVFIPLGFVFYLYLNWSYLGDPLAFIEIQKKHWNHELIPPWTQISHTLKTLWAWTPGTSRFVYYETRLAAMLLGVGLLLWGAKTLRPSWQIYSWLNLLLFMTAKNAISFPRYLWVLFPLFIILAAKNQRPLTFQLTLLSSTFMMAAWFMLYVTDKGAF